MTKERQRRDAGALNDPPHLHRLGLDVYRVGIELHGVGRNIGRLFKVRWIMRVEDLARQVCRSNTMSKTWRGDATSLHELVFAHFLRLGVDSAQIEAIGVGEVMTIRKEGVNGGGSEKSLLDGEILAGQAQTRRERGLEAVLETGIRRALELSAFGRFKRVVGRLGDKVNVGEIGVDRRERVAVE